MLGGGAWQGGINRPKFTVTVNVHWLVLQAFVAVQVTKVVPNGKKLPGGGEQLARVPLVTCGSE
jgi:hypothetical protein